MALALTTGAPTLFIRRPAYESSGLTRVAIDERLGLTPDEFRVEGELVAELEEMGLIYFDDFFELSGNWPEWLRLHASGR